MRALTASLFCSAPPIYYVEGWEDKKVLIYPADLGNPENIPIVATTFIGKMSPYKRGFSEPLGDATEDNLIQRVSELVGEYVKEHQHRMDIERILREVKL